LRVLRLASSYIFPWGAGYQTGPGLRAPDGRFFFFVNKEKEAKRKTFCTPSGPSPSVHTSIDRFRLEEVPASAKLRFARENIGFYMAARPAGPCCRAPQNFSHLRGDTAQHRFNNNLKSGESTRTPVSAKQEERTESQPEKNAGSTGRWEQNLPSKSTKIGRTSPKSRGTNHWRPKNPGWEMAAIRS